MTKKKEPKPKSGIPTRDEIRQAAKAIAGPVVNPHAKYKLAKFLWAAWREAKATEKMVAKHHEVVAAADEQVPDAVPARGRVLFVRVCCPGEVHTTSLRVPSDAEYFVIEGAGEIDLRPRSAKVEETIGEEAHHGYPDEDVT